MTEVTGDDQRRRTLVRLPINVGAGRQEASDDVRVTELGGAHERGHETFRGERFDVDGGALCRDRQKNLQTGEAVASGGFMKSGTCGCHVVDVVQRRVQKLYTNVTTVSTTTEPDCCMYTVIRTAVLLKKGSLYNCMDGTLRSKQYHVVSSKIDELSQTI